MKNALKNIGTVIWSPVVFLGMQLAVSFAYMIFMVVVVGFRIGFESALSGADAADIDPELMEEMLASSINLHIPVIISAAMAVLFVCLVMHKGWKKVSFWSFAKVKANPVILIICAGLGVSMNLFISGFYAMLPIPVQEQPFEILLGDNLPLMFMSLVVCAAFTEEIIFRGIVQKNLLKLMRVPGAIILQALIFGVIHFDFYQGSYAFILGLVIGIIYLWYDSVWVPIVMHAAFNSASVMLSHIAGDNPINAGIFMIITGAALFISAGFMMSLAGKRPKPAYDNITYNDNDNNIQPPFIG
jgi:hypothetical protein